MLKLFCGSVGLMLALHGAACAEGAVDPFAEIRDSGATQSGNASVGAGQEIDQDTLNMTGNPSILDRVSGPIKVLPMQAETNALFNTSNSSNSSLGGTFSSGSQMPPAPPPQDDSPLEEMCVAKAKDAVSIDTVTAPCRYTSGPDIPLPIDVDLLPSHYPVTQDAWIPIDTKEHEEH